MQIIYFISSSKLNKCTEVCFIKNRENINVKSIIYK